MADPPSRWDIGFAGPGRRAGLLWGVLSAPLQLMTLGWRGSGVASCATGCVSKGLLQELVGAGTLPRPGLFVFVRGCRASSAPVPVALGQPLSWIIIDGIGKAGRTDLKHQPRKPEC